MLVHMQAACHKAVAAQPAGKINPQQIILEAASLHQCCCVGPDLAAYGVDPVFKSGTDLYNADLDDETDTVSFYNCSTLGYNATYNIPNTDTAVTVTAPATAAACTVLYINIAPCLTIIVMQPWSILISNRHLYFELLLLTIACICPRSHDCLKCSMTSDIAGCLTIMLLCMPL